MNSGDGPVHGDARAAQRGLRHHREVRDPAPPPSARLARHPTSRHALFRTGMTLVEVLAVVVILGILAGTLAIGFSGAFGKGKRELARTGIGVIVGKLEMYRIERDAWPDMNAGLSALTDAGPRASYYLPPDSRLDPWGNPYIYISPGPDGHPFEVISYAGDGQPGGEGEDADVTSARLRS